MLLATRAAAHLGSVLFGAKGGPLAEGYVRPRLLHACLASWRARRAAIPSGAVVG
jgi:hypothetical protein